MRERCREGGPAGRWCVTRAAILALGSGSRVSANESRASGARTTAKRHSCPRAESGPCAGPYFHPKVLVSGNPYNRIEAAKLTWLTTCRPSTPGSLRCRLRKNTSSSSTHVPGSPPPHPGGPEDARLPRATDLGCQRTEVRRSNGADTQIDLTSS